VNPARRAASILSPVDVNDGDTPDGWELVRCREILELKYGKGLIEEKRIKGPVPVFGSNGIVGYHNIAVTAGPTIIVGRKVSVGAVHYSPVPCWPIDTAYFVDEFSGLDPQYLAHALRSLNLVNLDTSTAVPGLNRNDAYDQMVPVPPFAEQARIVDQLERLRIHSDLATRRLARSSSILKRCRQSVLAAACSGRLTEDWRETAYRGGLSVARPEASAQAPDDLPTIPDTWRWVRLPELGELSRGRSRHRPRDAAHLYGGPYPFIQTGDVAQSAGRITRHNQTYSEDGLAQSRLWPAGTVCITIAANIANSGILTYPACFPDSVVGLVANTQVCIGQYAEFFIRTARVNLSQFAPATAQKNINIAILSEVWVPLPPLSEQYEIVRRVEALFELARLIESRVVAAMARTDRLSQSILAKAFRGELVPTEAELARREGREYEPARGLLERARAERAGTIIKRRHHRRTEDELRPPRLDA
jgi:type I restriction enzyme, S subunit